MKRFLWYGFALPLVFISTALTALAVLLAINLRVGCKIPFLKPFLWMWTLYQPLSYWAIRRRMFGLLAKTTLSQSIFSVLTTFLAFPLGSTGMLFGQISMKIYIVSIIRPCVQSLFIISPSQSILTSVLFKYKNFSIYDILLIFSHLVLHSSAC